MAAKLACFLAVFLLATSGDALKCFTCSVPVGQNSTCEKPLANSANVQTEMCSGDYICARYTIENPVTSVKTISRSCRARNICETLKSQDGEYSKLIECRTCESDLCDSGEVFGYSLITMGICLVLSKVI